ncbi:MAG: hypothetical protein NVSMB6_16140 [Burkholderiaceae bacterium]
MTTSVVQAKDTPKAMTPAIEAGAPKTKMAAPMDINTASAKELATLPKIGDARAAAIIKGRPYKAKDELVEKKILSDDVYATVKDMIIAKQKPTKK